MKEAEVERKTFLNVLLAAPESEETRAITKLVQHTAAPVHCCRSCFGKLSRISQISNELSSSLKNVHEKLVKTSYYTNISDQHQPDQLSSVITCTAKPMKRPASSNATSTRKRRRLFAPSASQSLSCGKSSPGVCVSTCMNAHHDQYHTVYIPRLTMQLVSTCIIHMVASYLYTIDLSRRS